MGNFIMRALGIPAPNFGGIRFQTSTYGTPLPIVYGTMRIAGNIIDAPNINAAESASQGSKGGKGKGGNTVRTPIVIGLCQGPISGIGKVWQNQNAAIAFSTAYQPHNWTLFTGNTTQNEWSYLTSHYPNTPSSPSGVGTWHSLKYRGLAYLTQTGIELSGGSIPNLTWEVQGLQQDGAIGSGDANLADVLLDYLTNPVYGCGWDSSWVADLTDARDYCGAAQLQCSPVFDAQSTGRDHWNNLLEIWNSAAVWSDGQLKIVPYGDTAITTGSYSYTPNTTPIYSLSDNDFLRNSGSNLGSNSRMGQANHDQDLDPILLKRGDPAKAYNRVSVKYRDRDENNYNDTVQHWDGQDSQEQYGVIPMPQLSLPAITNGPAALKVATLRGQREQAVRNTYQSNVGWKYSLLEPMDLIEITDSGLGLVNQPVRILDIVEQSDEDGYTLIFEEWLDGVANAVLYPPAVPLGLAPNTAVDPGNTNTPVIVEAPRPLMLSPLDIMVGASGGVNWGGCEVWMSVDGTNYFQVGVMYGDTTYGVLTSALATGTAYPGTDSTHTLAVNVTTSNGTLVTQSAGAFAALTPLCYVGGEWLAYETATLTSAGHYNLTTLARGLYNSTIASSAAIGTPFVFLGSNMLRVAWPQGVVGQTVYFKLPAFNIYGSALQDLSAATAYSYLLGGKPLPFGGGLPGQGSAVRVAKIAAAAFTAMNTATTYSTLGSNELAAVSPTNYPDHPIPNFNALDYAIFRAPLIGVPDGATIVGVAQDLYDIAGTPTAPSFWGVGFNLYRAGTPSTSLAGATAAHGGGWQTIVGTAVTEDTTGNSYFIQVIVSNNAGQPTTDFAFGTAYVSYIV